MKYILNTLIFSLFVPTFAFAATECHNGNDTFEGSNEVTTLTYSGKRSDYTVSYSDGSETFTIADKLKCRDGRDSARDFEYYTFSDKTYSSDALAQEFIDSLYATLDLLRTQVEAILAQRQEQEDTQIAATLAAEPMCLFLTRELVYSDHDHNTEGQVTLLQLFLKSLGTNIYPEGQVTGYYGTLTTKAVSKYQVENDIYLDVDGQTGEATRAYINNFCDNFIEEKERLRQEALNGNSQVTEVEEVRDRVVLTADDGESEPITIVNGRSAFFVESTLPSSMNVGETYRIEFNASGFSGVDLLYIAGYDGDVHQFFGSTLPSRGSMNILIPSTFSGHNEITLIAKYQNDVLDSTVIPLNN